MNNITETIKENALNDYQGAVAELKDFCKEETNFVCEISVDKYPIVVKLTPAPQQMSFLDTQKNTTTPGEDASVLITVGPTTRMASTLKFQLDAPLLKKLIKKSEKVGKAYLHAFRAAAQIMLETGDAEAIKQVQEI